MRKGDKNSPTNSCSGSQKAAPAEENVEAVGKALKGLLVGDIIAS
jgi:hypothetical protein